MPTLSTSAVIREVLSANMALSADDVIKAVRRKGVTAPEKAVRNLVHNIKSEMKKGAAKAVPAAARLTPTPVAKPAPAPKSAPAPKPAPKATTPKPAPVAKPTPAPAAGVADLSSLLANVSLVNRVAGLAGSVENARQVAEAVRACGGVDNFLQHLDTVAGIRAAE